MATVRVAQEQVWRVLVDGVDRWWPHRTGGAAVAEMTLEPHVDGQWVARGLDGTERAWGRVRVWSAPSRLVLACLDPSGEAVGEVEVVLAPEEPGVTRIELVHTGTAPEDAVVAADVAAAGGWDAVLEVLAEAAERAGSRAVERLLVR